MTPVDVQNTLLSKKSQTQKATQCTVPLIRNAPNGQIHRQSGDRPSAKTAGGWCRVGCGILMDGGFPFWGVEVF